ncbi:peptidase S8/S53 domain-containing protein [Calycina marina]|uniref:tripeptidyl-peptidase II n=1 Tax=Calycina marina TaxID=1763456 RepID=A0A9P7Z0D2_9HELO|nr:peptidase S8/S53 domain-containing protein [Calycina marina]
MLLRTLLAALVGAAVIKATGSSGVFESLYEVPQGWTRRGKPDASQQLRLQVALSMPDQALFEQTIYEVSTPDHHRYGQHLDRREVQALVMPRESASSSVLAWLQSSGVAESDILHENEWITFRTTVSNAEKMLDTTFDYYTQDADKSQTNRIRTLQYSIPDVLHDYVAMIEPTTRFGQLKPARHAPFSVEPFRPTPNLRPASTRYPSCDATTMTPSCLRELYSIGNYTANPHCGSLLGVCGFLEEYAKYDALDTFLKEYAPYAISQNFSYVLVNGGLSTQNDYFHDDIEGNLDIQYTASLGFKTNLTYYSTGGRGLLVPDLTQPDIESNSNEPYLALVKHLLTLSNDKLPQTITTSYGENEQTVPITYAKTVCSMFGQLAARGVSIIFSSGDSGVGSGCQTNDGKNTTRFMPIFPATCPWVTSVGGTHQIEPEFAVDFSSGGFSDYWPMPDYQKNAVKEYLDKLGDKWTGLYNPQGRGFPDVAAQAVSYHVYEGKYLDLLVGGTSASAPAFAAMIALLSSARMSEGKPPLGFLNPMLYTLINTTAFTDIVDGGSTGCTGRDQFFQEISAPIPYASWNATVGWDPVTGLGTPNFDRLLQAVAPKRRLGQVDMS